MKKFLGIALSAVVIAAVVFGILINTGDEETTPPDENVTNPTPVTIVDSSGREVELMAPVDKAIVTYSQLLLIMKAVGVEDDSIVGLDEFTLGQYENIFTGLQGKPTVGSNLFNLDMEKIIELEPQVIISTPSTLSRMPELESQLDSLGIKFIGLDFSWDNVSNVISTLGTVFGQDTRAEQFDSFWWGVFDDVTSKVSTLTDEEKLKVYWENTADGYVTVGQSSANNEMLEMAGAINIAGSFEVSSPTVDPEWIITQNPDVIFKYPMGATDQGGFGSTDTSNFQAMMAEIMTRPGFGEIQAVQEGRVYIVSQLIKTGAFQNIAVLYIAKIIYPDLFQDLNPEDKLREMVEDYLGLDFEQVKGVFVYPEPWS
ncbi:MAG: ABC transporter substrate-binding protein [Dehalococcoides mccartyi]|uniref:ABC transporter substrate-binding protein n=1 Tax=Dehalococcoides mccartyi TaxID=61435 RepID=UPI0024311568|nr:ABC transporter substrate-binding protein [Dehalococcoides mccartyi]MCF7635289.1 ABC transporter substrate-binding protein [Dehalococcoides mccartyi]MEA2122210.1 Vitamin B12-binding protein [Dehalococcoides mccartyi]